MSLSDIELNIDWLGVNFALKMAVQKIMSTACCIITSKAKINLSKNQ